MFPGRCPYAGIGAAASAAAFAAMVFVVSGFRPTPPDRIVALLVGLSRVYLGVHWPSDILGGYAAGAFLLSAGICGLRGRRGG